MRSINTPDERVMKTMQKLERALFHLLQEYNICDITISQLCHEAHINRSTFYAYFHSISELLDFYQDYYIKIFYKEINQKWISQEGIKIFYHDLLHYIYQNKEVFYCLFSYNEQFINKILSLALDKLISPNNSFYPQLTQKDLVVAKMFNVYGCVGLLHLWLMHDCQESIDDMVMHLYQCTTKILMLKS